MDTMGARHATNTKKRSRCVLDTRSAQDLLDYRFEKWHGNLSERALEAESVLIALAGVLLASVENPVLIKDDLSSRLVIVLTKCMSVSLWII